MKNIACLFVFISFHIVALSQPIALHPNNPHYFIYEGKPTVLITSAEHYGAILNRAFDYERYLNTLAKDGMNYTRVIVGSYVEAEGVFNIKYNTLAPEPNEYISPWKRKSSPGLYENEGKVDLTQWNPEFFERLQGFVSKARDLGIIVEATFFSSIYNEKNWSRNAFNSANNINNTPIVEREKSNTLENGKILGFQKALVKKVVAELNQYDNLFYEIQNEPWSLNARNVNNAVKTLGFKELKWAKWSATASNASLKWQKEIAKTVVETEIDLPKKHLIAQNYCNFKHSLEQVDTNISILNFHYAWPEAIKMNYAWNRPVGYDESGFSGTSDTSYLVQAWEFILAGGAIFNNLDYSFYVGSEDGLGVNNAPGGGSATLRGKLKILRDFIHSFNFIQMQPDNSVVFHAPGVECQAISEKGKQYAILLNGTPTKWIKLKLLLGEYQYEFISPFTGEILSKGNIKSEGGISQVNMPVFERIVGLKIVN